ncbi:hypothetical protein IQ268_09435 [Oculatella sp. LEGE 06141]|uniref:hypothetical protein n=1 Tax=Oculatella sp. LEGE 06141 TaxID=1828648 RepID=UPI001880AFAF|nr:hypothetical protein [Oculatella sp. LEGE 06141]MBE9178780.1 hypothetical protein [Oculatella sp. LEGE 06141]
MPYFSRLSLLVVSALALSACGADRETTVSQSAITPSPSPAVSVPAPSVSPAPEVTPPATGAQTYQEKNGLFEISFPQGYNYQETGSGIAFVSGDQGFGGSIDYGPAQGTQLTSDQLEEALKAEYQRRLQQIDWQASSVQPDGSVRVDWTGKDGDGNDLDAISFVEQRGDTIFILNLFGINKSYQTYNSDAEAIVNSYRTGNPQG